MTIFLHSIIILFCVIGLWGGAVWIVTSASKIAKKLGLSELVIGLTVVAFATSAPEFAVSVSASLKGESAISVGNVVGSNIFNLGFILGLVALYSSVKINRLLLYRDGFLLIGTGLILLVFFRDLELTWQEGTLLLVTLVLYTFVLLKQKADADEVIPEGTFKWYDVIKLIIGISIVIASAHFFVNSAAAVARSIGISEWLIGITIVAAGTSTPELATSLVAVAKGKHGISIGNLIGSDLFNMLGVLGTASVLRPLSIDQSDYFSLIFLAATLIILFIFMRTGWKLSKREGVLLLLIAIARWVSDFLF